jgi:hypothetical protein
MDTNKKINNAQSGAIYGLCFIGAAVYFILKSTCFWGGIWGVIKAIVWPTILVFEAFKTFGI